jgi:MSHA biogenesis protein MshL
MTMRILLFLAVVSAAFAESPLDRPVPPLRFDNAALPVALRVLGRAAQTPIAAEPDLAPKVTAELGGGTLRTTLAGITGPLGLYFEEEAGTIMVRRLKTVLYPIDYPQLTRSGSGSASITLGGANNGGGQVNPATLAAAQALGANGLATDATQISISQENQNTFWTTLESELRTMLKDGDGLVLNRFSGVAQVTAPLGRHVVIRSFLDLVSHRITQQVEIEARLVEVTLHDEQKLGVDWELATASLSPKATLGGGATVDVTGVGGTLLSANTFAANLGWGHATAVINALKQQGDLKTVAQPRLRTLNNQTAMIKIGEDRPFFRLQQSTSFQTAGSTNPVNQTQENFSVSTITIGTILAVTPQIDGNGVITLDVLPAITRLQAIVTSPDGRQTAPVTEVKQASTIVRLKDGETAVIGGLISEETGETTRGVPILGSVPLAGAAFRSKAKLRNRTELVIVLTPRLIR